MVNIFCALILSFAKDTNLIVDLFELANHSNPGHLPLAEALRPQRLEDMLGQANILGDEAPFRRIVNSGQIPSLILWGPPGTGKTTFALLLSKKVDAEFVMINAVETGAKALRELGDLARLRKLQHRRRTLVFIDEIHRLNKGQQDVLLPFVEKGEVTLVGATTENPSYEINAALLSRCRVLVFEKLSIQALRELAERAVQSRSQSLSHSMTLDHILDSPAIERVLELADGDGRRLLNLIELLLELHHPNQAHSIPSEVENKNSLIWPLSLENLAKVFNSATIRYDKNGDEHYDTVSAFIKSVRGSDPDAAIYYLARMIKGGEDPVFIARRLVILASEDIGNADPRALTLAVSGLQAVELVGWPEAAISLAQVTTYLASAPKSNRAYEALKRAQDMVEKTGSLPIPPALRSAKSALATSLGFGKDYRYSHDGPKGFVQQRFLPEELGKVRIYEPTDHGFEKNIRQYLEWLKS